MGVSRLTCLAFLFLCPKAANAMARLLWAAVLGLAVQLSKASNEGCSDVCTATCEAAGLGKPCCMACGKDCDCGSKLEEVPAVREGCSDVCISTCKAAGLGKVCCDQ